jgi:hypothetical protein
VPIAGDGPCALLTITEVRQAFPDSQPGEPDRNSGSARACGWSHRGGRLSIAIAPASSGPIKDDAAMWAREWLDPFRRDAVSNLRFEVLRSVGDDAIALVEAADARRGLVDSGAMLIVRRGSTQATVMASSLASRDRSEALRILEQLGSALAARLE